MGRSEDKDVSNTFASKSLILRALQHPARSLIAEARLSPK